MDIVIQASQLLLSLSILVILHELGHFIPAKLFKTRVEKFYLFFDPWFSLFKKKKGETEYGIGWLPLGGYVKISGMIDESMDTEQMKEEPKPWEFRSKPAWQRLIIMVGGVAVNVLLAMLIYAMTLFVWGEKYLPSENLSDGIWCADSSAYTLGLQNGDKILAIDGEKAEKFNDVMPMIITGKTIEIERNGSKLNIDVPTDFIETLIDQRAALILYPRIPTMVANVASESKNAGIIKERDKIVGINGNRIKYFDELKTALQGFSEESVEIRIERDGSIIDEEVYINDKHNIGFTPAMYSHSELEKHGIYEYAKREYGFLESIPSGISKAINKLEFYVDQFKLILNPETGAYKGLGGFASIGKLFPATWSWQAFWEVTAFLSIILAFMNILPIPALDGGHVMFLIYEMITRRKPHQKVMEYAQIAGIVLLLGLMVFANGNDIIRMFQ